MFSKGDSCLVALVLAIASLVGKASAFGPLFPNISFSTTSTITSSQSSKKTTSTCLFANSNNIRAAMEATEMYGIYSPEAKLAWEVVEEFDASTNDSAAYEAGKTGPGLSQEELNQAYADVQASMELMQQNQYAVVSFQNNQQLMKDVAAELQAIKLSPPAKKPSPTIPGLWDAKLKARAFTQQYGTQSAEAKLAWEEVEEIASSGLENAVGGTLFEEDSCDIVQAAEACMALEELDRFLYYENYHVGDNLENNNYVEENYTENYNQEY
jgi:hypothetical protein